MYAFCVKVAVLPPRLAQPAEHRTSAETSKIVLFMAKISPEPVFSPRRQQAPALSARQIIVTRKDNYKEIRAGH